MVRYKGRAQSLNVRFSLIADLQLSQPVRFVPEAGGNLSIETAVETKLFNDKTIAMIVNSVKSLLENHKGK